MIPRCPRCRALTREDNQFTADAQVYGCPQRRWLCSNGHSVYTGLPDTTLPSRMVTPAVRVRGRAVTKRCAYCAEPFEGSTQQKYCSEVCIRARDVERTQHRKLAARRMTATALRRVRAVPCSPRRTAPSAYAPRPRSLSKAWV
jgi:hypothetical protein